MKQNLTPLRSWSSPSYCVNTGRATSSISQPTENSYSVEGERISPNRQMPVGQTAPGTPSLKQLDQNRTQGGPVRNRPLG